MAGAWRTEREQVRSEPDETARPSPLAFVARIVLVLILVAAFLLLFKRSTRLEPKLQAVLDREEAAFQAGDWQAFAALLDADHAPFRQFQKTWFDSMMRARRHGEYVGSPYPLHVVEAGRRDTRAWARVSGEQRDGQPVYRVEFFRQVYGSWLHTGPDPAWWGAEREQHTAHVVWRYREAEEAWIARIAPLMEAVHERACADLGLDPQRSVVTFDVCYSIDCNYILFYPAGPTIDLPAPLLTGWPEEWVGEMLPGVLVGHLIVRAAGDRVDRGVSVGGTSVLMEGIRVWEIEQVMATPPDPSLFDELRAAAAGGQFLSIADMASPQPLDGFSLRMAQSYALVDYLVTTQGPGVLPVLAHASSPSTTLVEALQQVLGPEADLAMFEQGWMAWMREKYGE